MRFQLQINNRVRSLSGECKYTESVLCDFILIHDIKQFSGLLLLWSWSAAPLLLDNEECGCWGGCCCGEPSVPFSDCVSLLLRVRDFGVFGVLLLFSFLMRGLDSVGTNRFRLLSDLPFASSPLSSGEGSVLRFLCLFGCGVA